MTVRTFEPVFPGYCLRTSVYRVSTLELVFSVLIESVPLNTSIFIVHRVSTPEPVLSVFAESRPPNQHFQCDYQDLRISISSVYRQ